MHPRVASVTALVVVVTSVLLLMLLTTWAASIGPGAVLRGEGLEPVRISLTPTPTASVAPVEPADGEQQLIQEIDPPWFVRPLGYLLVAAGGAVVLVLGVALVRRLLRRHPALRVRRGPSRPPVEFDVLTVPAALAAEIVRDAERQRTALSGGTPRTGIVDCWIRFEEQAARSGVAPRESETSTEFTVRILALVAADQAAVTQLAELYREARFSEHEMPERLRDEAVEALAAIHDTLLGSAAGSRS